MLVLGGQERCMQQSSSTCMHTNTSLSMMYAATPTHQQSPQVNVPLFPILKSILKNPKTVSAMPEKTMVKFPDNLASDAICIFLQDATCNSCSGRPLHSMIGRLHQSSCRTAGRSGLHGCEALMFPTNWGLHYSTLPT
jgi:hypothetical protein